MSAVFTKLTLIAVALLSLQGPAIVGTARAANSSEKSFTDGWYPNEKPVISDVKGVPNQRVGQTPEGFDYHFNSNRGQVNVDGTLWGAECGVDAMTDKSWCNAYLVGRTGLVFRFGDRSVPDAVCMLSESLEPASGMIRIDTGSAHQTGADGCVQFENVKEIAAGKVVLTRTNDVGPDGATDRQMDLGGYSRAINFMEFIRQKASKLAYE